MSNHQGPGSALENREICGSTPLLPSQVITARKPPIKARCSYEHILHGTVATLEWVEAYIQEWVMQMTSR